MSGGHQNCFSKNWTKNFVSLLILVQQKKTISVKNISQKNKTVWNRRGGGYKVFCNPPYGKEISKWVEKAYEENKKGVLVVLLLPARTDTRWFHNFIYKKHEIRFIKGRLKFNDCKQPAPFPSMVVVMK